ncbi:MAG: helix-turn-helix transcriptional regulator [Alphaproteobacteria bacterium]|nr:helix-turn-helix transcriptional regulator [Alphaproteobacteria bacterium]
MKKQPDAISRNMSQTIEMVGKNLKHLRTEHGLTQKGVADILGVSFQQVQKYETGYNKLPIENLLLLKHYYNTSFDSFFRGIHAMTDDEMQENEGNLRASVARINAMTDQAKRRKIIRVIQILAA